MSTATSSLDAVIGGDEVRRDAQKAKALAAQAEKAMADGDSEAAVNFYRQAVEADSSDAALLFQAAFRFDLAGEEHLALETYKKAYAQGPAPINLLLNLAVMHEDAGDYAMAERLLKQILDTDPNHPRAKLYMKDVLASKGEKIEDDLEKDKFKRNALLDTPVTDFELSVRARTCLKKMNIRTLGDLVRATEAELLSYKNFGENSLTEIRQMLAAKGLRLGQGRDEAHRVARKQMIDQFKGTNQEAVLGKGVSELNLSVRARRALQLLSIQTLGDLISHTEAELLGVKNFGATSLTELRNKLTEYGLSLRKIEA
jgi:DNA-directed RNA polymerase subunit alpha